MYNLNSSYYNTKIIIFNNYWAIVSVPDATLRNLNTGSQ